MMNYNQQIFTAIFGLLMTSSALAESEPFFCREARDCNECMLNGCSWGMGQCIDNCNQIADAKCYNLQPFPNMDSRALCARIEMERLDDQLCATQQGCFTCQAAIKSDGKRCEYYIDPQTKMGYCGTGGCDMHGNCPLNKCPTGGRPIAPPLPVNYNCQDRSSCSQCLAGGSTCAWSNDKCHNSCNAIADAACYTQNTFPDKDGWETCAYVEEREVNEQRCKAPTTCEECTTTHTSNVVSGGAVRCTWYQDGPNGWCGAGGCDMNGNCGVADHRMCLRAMPAQAGHSMFRGSP